MADQGTLTSNELTALQADLAAELGDECVVERITDTGDLNLSDAQLVGETRDTIYSGHCDITPIVARRDRFDIRGEQQIYQLQYRVLLPNTASGIKVGDIYRTTVSDDTELVGREMTVKDVHYVSDIAIRRITVLDIKE